MACCCEFICWCIVVVLELEVERTMAKELGLAMRKVSLTARYCNLLPDASRGG